MNEILQSKTLTCDEVRVLVYLLSLPKDWSIYKTNIWKKINIGRDRFNKTWKSLESLGYIVKNPILGKNNMIDGYSYIIYEEPVKSDLPKTSQSEQLSKPDIEITEIQENREPVCIQKNNITKDININNTSTKDIINTGTNIVPDILGKISTENNFENTSITTGTTNYAENFEELITSKENLVNANSKLTSKELYNKLIPEMYSEKTDRINLLKYVFQSTIYHKDLLDIIWYYSSTYPKELKILFYDYSGQMDLKLKVELAESQNVQFAASCKIMGIDPKDYIKKYKRLNSQ
ncbi:MAG: hypothetical protein EOM47_01075 [Bacteroidia bacterium]|nr:hypothetical protein [Bacteroidia bacterium]